MFFSFFFVGKNVAKQRFLFVNSSHHHFQNIQWVILSIQTFAGLFIISPPGRDRKDTHRGNQDKAKRENWSNQKRNNTSPNIQMMWDLKVWSVFEKMIETMGRLYSIISFQSCRSWIQYRPCSIHLWRYIDSKSIIPPVVFPYIYIYVYAFFISWLRFQRRLLAPRSRAPVTLWF